MANLITNTTSGNPSVSFNSSELKIGLGNKLLIDAGAVNTIVLGVWNRLIAGTTTEIQLGAAAEISMINAVSVTLGDSWNYLSEHQTIAADSYSISGLRQVVLASGMSYKARTMQISERQKANKVLLAVIGSFAFTLGISLIIIQFPPFKTSFDVNDSKVIELNPNGVYTIIGETIAMICLFFAQYILAKKMAKTSKNINAVSSLSLAANGIQAAVYSNPDEQPQLILANSVVQKNKGDYYSTGKSAAAIINICPGAIDSSRFNENNDLHYRNWKNPKHGLYPPHYDTPIIELTVHSPKTTSLVEKEFENTPLSNENEIPLLHLNKNEESDIQLIDVNADKANHFFSSGLTMIPCTVGISSTSIKSNIDVILNCEEKNSIASITNYDKNENGGIIFVSEAITVINRNYGDAIEVSCINDGEHIKTSSSNISNSNFENILYVVDDDETSEENDHAASSIPPDSLENNNYLENSLLHLSSAKASLTLSDGNHGILIDHDKTQIKVMGKTLASFNPQEITIYDVLKSKVCGTSIIGEVIYKDEKRRIPIYRVYQNKSHELLNLQNSHGIGANIVDTILKNIQEAKKELISMKNVNYTNI